MALRGATAVGSITCTKGLKVPAIVSQRDGFRGRAGGIMVAVAGHPRGLVGLFLNGSSLDSRDQSAFLLAGHGLRAAPCSGLCSRRMADYAVREGPELLPIRAMPHGRSITLRTIL